MRYCKNKLSLFTALLFFICQVKAQSPFTQANAQHIAAGTNLSALDSLISTQRSDYSSFYLSQINVSQPYTIKSIRNIDRLINENNNSNVRIDSLENSDSIANATEIFRLKDEVKQKETEINSIRTSNKKIVDSLRFINFQVQSVSNTRQIELNKQRLKLLTDTLDLKKEKLKKINSGSFFFNGLKLSSKDSSKYNKLINTLLINKVSAANQIDTSLQSNAAKAKATIIKFEKVAEKLQNALELGIIGDVLPKIQVFIDSSDNLSKEFNVQSVIINNDLNSMGNLAASIDNDLIEAKSILAEYEKKDEQNDGDIKAIANFTQPLGEEGKLVPQISVLAFKQFNSSARTLSYNMRLFVAPSENKSELNSQYRLFIPEASTYGFMADASFGFITVEGKDKDQDKMLAINVGAYYLGKSVVRSDKTSYNIGLLEFKAGMQLVLIKHVLSIYANLNPFFISNGLSDFKTTYSSYNNKLNNFVDFGINSYLDLTKKQEDFFLNFDLGFISNTGDMRGITASTDPLLPRIKVGLVKSFNF